MANALGAAHRRRHTDDGADGAADETTSRDTKRKREARLRQTETAHGAPEGAEGAQEDEAAKEAPVQTR